MGFFKPTLGKVGFAVVLFILFNVFLGVFCNPIPSIGAAWGYPHDMERYGYPCGYISYSLSSKASITDTNILRILVVAIAYSVPCLVLFLAHKLKEQ
jgi:hypothetical protein